MTYIARAELAAAVSEAGGLGMLETLTPEGREDLHRVRSLTDRPVAANLMIQGWKRDPSIVDVLAEAGVRHVFTSAGDPAHSSAAELVQHPLPTRRGISLRRVLHRIINHHQIAAEPRHTGGSLPPQPFG
jgi:NAD(P)H-dependent flavin oxidoreductase YrpB (nitropropane dioxygenase family)